MKRWIQFVCATAVFLLPALAQGAGFILVPDSESNPDTRILPPTQPRPVPPRVWLPPERRFIFAPLEIASVDVTSRITGQIATTKVEEEFYNPNERSIEGTFLFPLPPGAHIEKFAMEIGGRPVEAELLDAEKARHLYEEIVRKVKDPALLEYSGRDLLKARVFPIEAHGRKRVTLSYSELLKSDAGLVRYAFPLGTGKFSATPIKSISVSAELSTNKPLKSIYSPSHNVEIQRTSASQATVRWKSSNTTPEAEFELLFAAEQDEVGFNLITHPTGPGEGFFLLLAAPGWAAPAQKPLPKDVVFVLDTSGSMAGAKLEQAKRALSFCVENLNDADGFEIIRFATETEPLFSQIASGSAENRARAQQFIKQLRPIGGTAIDEALRKALAARPKESDRPFIVVFLTDGRPTVGLTDDDRIVARINESDRSHRGNTRIFCFGIGTDVNTHLLDRITEETHAYSQYVLPEEDIEVKVSNFFTKIREPMLANLNLEAGKDVRLSQMYPPELPDLFRGEQLVLVGRYTTSPSSGPIPLTLEGKAAGETKRFTYEVRFPASAAENSFLPRLWATRRVGYLLDQIRLRGENKELQEEVTQLARQYGIVTPYTAYLILEDETGRGVPLAVQSVPQFREDRIAREAAGRFYAGVNRDKSGPTAVTASRYGLTFKQATSVEALSEGTQEAQRGFTATLASPGNAPLALPGVQAQGAETARRIAGYSQKTRFVAGRNFFLNGNRWIESTVQKHGDAPRVQIKFSSPEYFDLLHAHPETGAWLALGPSLEFVLGSRVYEIVE